MIDHHQHCCRHHNNHHHHHHHHHHHLQQKLDKIRGHQKLEKEAAVPVPFPKLILSRREGVFEDLILKQGGRGCATDVGVMERIRRRLNREIEAERTIGAF